MLLQPPDFASGCDSVPHSTFGTLSQPESEWNGQPAINPTPAHLPCPFPSLSWLPVSSIVCIFAQFLLEVWSIGQDVCILHFKRLEKGMYWPVQAVCTRRTCWLTAFSRFIHCALETPRVFNVCEFNGNFILNLSYVIWSVQAVCSCYPFG